MLYWEVWKDGRLIAAFSYKYDTMAESFTYAILGTLKNNSGATIKSYENKGGK